MPHDEDGDDEEVFVAVHDGKAYDYSTDKDVIVTISESGVLVKADEGTIRSSNISGPYIIHDLKGKLAIRAMTQEDEKFLKSKFDAGIKPRNEDADYVGEEKGVEPKEAGSVMERMAMRRKEHKEKMELLQLETKYWKKLYNYEFGVSKEEHEESSR